MRGAKSTQCLKREAKARMPTTAAVAAAAAESNKVEKVGFGSRKFIH